MIPSAIYRGDRVAWTDELAPADATGVAVWFRTSVAGQGLSAAGALGELGWELTLEAAATASMGDGIWQYQSIATTPEGSRTYDTGRMEVRASLAFSGTPSAIDTRTQAEKDLEAVEEAIRALTAGAQSYTIQQRTFTRVSLGALIAWRDRLIAKVTAERQAAGLGRRDRRILVRFD